MIFGNGICCLCSQRHPSSFDCVAAKERGAKQMLQALERYAARALKCPGVSRDKDCITALQFYFNRPVSDDEMRFLHDVMQRTVACLPKAATDRTDPEGGTPGRAN